MLLLYPAWIYYDLAGMGGYDGFASLEMMRKYGAWSSNIVNSVEYIAFSILTVLWLFSLLNIPIAALLAFKLLRERRHIQ